MVAMVGSGIVMPRWKAWILACRPKTLPAAVAPVLMGTAVAWKAGVLHVPAALIALVCALLIQITTNFANDYFDYKKGADRPDRIGPLRVVQSGLIAPIVILRAVGILLGITFLLGLYLVYLAGWPILVIGIISLICAVAYTAGPFPLAYRGMGDLFVFLFFGLAAVNGTYYVQAQSWSWTAFAASLPAGFLSTAILVINNYRDIDSDTISGKRTLAVRLGRARTRIEYLALILLSFVVPLLQVLIMDETPRLLLIFFTVPLAIQPIRIIFTRTDGPSLNRGLAATGRLLAIYAIVYSIAML